MSPIDIVMAVFRPDPDHLRQQINSLAAQSFQDFTLYLVIADNKSGPDASAMAEAAGLNYELIDPGQELDSVRAFERGLTEVILRDPAPVEEDGVGPLIALCDQDDIWHPERLAQGIKALQESGADLVHSDARIVAADGSQVHPSMFQFERRSRNSGLRRLLYRNNITGMTTLMRRRVVEVALPFPPQSGVHFYHDLWLGLVAAAMGGVHLIREPLVDYRQHSANAIGAVDRQNSARVSGVVSRIGKINKLWLRREASGYGLARYLAHTLKARFAEGGAGIDASQVDANLKRLSPYLRRLRGSMSFGFDAFKLALTGQFSQARIAAGFAIVSMGRGLWILRHALGPELTRSIRRFDNRLYSLSPGMNPPSITPDLDDIDLPEDAEEIIDRRKIPQWTPDFSASEPAVTLLVPTLNPTEVFAGIATAIDITLGLAAAGYRVRIVATDLPISSLATSRAFVTRRLSSAARDAGAEARITLHCGIHDDEIPAHVGDTFIATAWWSAHIADTLIRKHGFSQKQFVYLIQDYEPNFYAWGPEYADAEASYGFDFIPIFNTSLLRDYFAENGYAFAGSESLTFRPSIDVARYANGKRADQTDRPRRLALYGRPEVPRNMFPTAIEALSDFITAEALTPGDIELVSIGLKHSETRLPNGLVLKSLGKLPWEDYPDYLLGVDLGLCLMYSPHPSHPPLEMAASGARVVTNLFGPKDLSKLSPALTAAPANATALAKALSDAWTMPPPSADDRQIDIAQLGLPLDTLVANLSTLLKPRFESET